MPTSYSTQPEFQTPSLALLTDLYQLTMAYGYWKADMHNQEAVFHLFFRKRPFNGGFAIAAGLEAVINYLKNFRFDKSDLEYLATLKGIDDTPLFEDGFFDYLSTMRFTCDVDAIPEGRAVFPYEPLIRVQGPLIQAQLLESTLLNLINFPTLIATKAARICLSAQDDAVLEFGLRRAQGIDGALTASRAAFIGGCEATSNVLAGKIFDIPVKGTHAHSWVMVFDDELEAFQTYAKQQSNNCIFLVDTYDTLEGVKKAIEVGKWLKANDKKMVGIRLDSGDLAYLSIQSRQMLDEAGLHEAKIIASNDLDETIITELKRNGACINVWGVGTHLVTGGTQPALDGVYKLSAIREVGKEWKHKIKLSEQMTKVSTPGILQVRRYTYKEEYVADVIYDTCLGVDEMQPIVDPMDPTRQKKINPLWKSQELLVPIFRQGKCLYDLPSLKAIQSLVKKELTFFHSSIKRFLSPHEYVVGMEKKLYELKLNLVKEIRANIVTARSKE